MIMARLLALTVISVNASALALNKVALMSLNVPNI